MIFSTSSNELPSASILFFCVLAMQFGWGEIWAEVTSPATYVVVVVAAVVVVVIAGGTNDSVGVDVAAVCCC